MEPLDTEDSSASTEGLGVCVSTVLVSSPSSSSTSPVSSSCVAVFIFLSIPTCISLYISIPSVVHQVITSGGISSVPTICLYPCPPSPPPSPSLSLITFPAEPSEALPKSTTPHTHTHTIYHKECAHNIENILSHVHSLCLCVRTSQTFCVYSCPSPSVTVSIEVMSKQIAKRQNKLQININRS